MIIKKMTNTILKCKIYGLAVDSAYTHCASWR